MPPKRKSSPAESMSRSSASIHDSPDPADTYVSEQTEGDRKRFKSSPDSQVSQENIEDTTGKSKKGKKNTTARKSVAVKKTDDKSNQSTTTVPPKSRRGPELKGQVIESRNRERQRAGEAEASIEKLKSQIGDLSSRSEKQIERISYLERSKLAASGQDRAYFQDDDVIRGNIALLFDKISTWALNWAHQGYFMSNLNTSVVTATINMLGGQSKHLETRVLREGAAAKCSWANAGCRLATEAFLANTIAKLFLAHPLDIPTLSNFDTCTGMKEFVRRVRDGMKDTQIETHMWMSTMLRSYYSPDQYTDSISKPITNDQFQEARMHRYESVTSEWMLQKESPLAPLLKSCQENQAKSRKAGMIKILHAASKLSLQLWAQDSEVEVFDNMQDQQGILHRFDEKLASLHPLTPAEFPKDVVLQGSEIDLLVRPRLMVTRYNSIPQGTRHRTSTKASIVIFSQDVCKKNKANFDKMAELQLNASTIAVPTQAESANQDLKDVAISAHAEIAGSSEFSSRTCTDESDKFSQQPLKEPADTVKEKIQKDSDIDKLMAESDESSTSQQNPGENIHTNSDSPHRPFTDLADESTTSQSTKLPQEPLKETRQECSQKRESPTEIRATMPSISGPDRAVPMLPEPHNARSEDDHSQAQKSPAKNAIQSEPTIDTDSKEEKHAGVYSRSSAASHTSSKEPQRLQSAKNQTDLASLHQIGDVDPEKEVFKQPLEPQRYEDNAEGNHGLGRKVYLTRKLSERNDGDEDSDTIRVVIPQPSITPIEKPQDKAKNDLKVDTKDTMDVDKETQTEDIEIGQGQNSIDKPIESAIGDAEQATKQSERVS